MSVTEDDILDKSAKRCLHCTRNTLLPYEKEDASVACGYNVVK